MNPFDARRAAAKAWLNGRASAAEAIAALEADLAAERKRREEAERVRDAAIRAHAEEQEIAVRQQQRAERAEAEAARLRGLLRMQPCRCKCLTHGFGCGLGEATCRSTATRCSRCAALAAPPEPLSASELIAQHGYTPRSAERKRQAMDREVPPEPPAESAIKAAFSHQPGCRAPDYHECTCAPEPPADPVRDAVQRCAEIMCGIVRGDWDANGSPQLTEAYRQLRAAYPQCFEEADRG